MRPKILQLFPLLPSLQAQADTRYDIVHEPAPDVVGIITNAQIGVTPEMIGALPALKIIGISGVGFDRVDLALTKARGIAVTNTPDVLTDDVADLAIGLMINVLRRLPAADAYVRQGGWRARQPLAFSTRVSGRRYGIVGMGRIGQAIATRLSGFGGSIAYASRTRKSVDYAFYPDATSLAAACDILILAAPASPETKHIVNRAVLDALGPQGVLINIGRGSLVDEPALVAALQEGRIGAAGLDVFEDEPNVPDALIAMENVTLAPHIGSATVETRTAMGQLMLDNMQAFFAGEPLLTPVQ